MTADKPVLCASTITLTVVHVHDESTPLGGAIWAAIKELAIRGDNRGESDQTELERPDQIPEGWADAQPYGGDGRTVQEYVEGGASESLKCACCGGEWPCQGTRSASATERAKHGPKLPAWSPGSAS